MTPTIASQQRPPSTEKHEDRVDSPQPRGQLWERTMNTSGLLRLLEGGRATRVIISLFTRPSATARNYAYLRMKRKINLTLGYVEHSVAGFITTDEEEMVCKRCVCGRTSWGRRIGLQPHYGIHLA